MEKWTPERKEKAAASHRRRLGIPDGFARVFGVHVPLAYREALTLAAKRIQNRQGSEYAAQYVQAIKDSDYAEIAIIQKAYQTALDARTMRKLIFQFKNEARQHAKNKNFR